jgi:hypothetical protein
VFMIYLFKLVFYLARQLSAPSFDPNSHRT